MPPKAKKAAKMEKAPTPTAVQHTKMGKTANSVDAHLSKVHAALQTISNCAHFKDMPSLSPLSLKDGGTEHAYTASVAKSVLAGGTSFTAAGNFMWIDHTWMNNHRVPVNPGQIKHLQKTKFPYADPPLKSPFRAVVALVESQDASAGGLQRLTPEEIDHAILFSLAEAIGKDVGDPILRRWVKMLLSFPMTFEVVPEGDSRMWRAQNLREELVDIGETVRRSTTQRIHDIVGFKMEKEAEKHETWNAFKVAKQYKVYVKLARSSEEISQTFVENAITIHKRLLSVRRNQELLDWCDEYYAGSASERSHPFPTINSLLSLCERAHTPAKITWSLELMLDHYRMEYIDLGHFSSRKLKDPKESYVCVCTLKLDARTYLLGPWLDGLDINPTTKSKAREIFASVENVRQWLSPYGDVAADTTWQANWFPSSTLTFQLIEDLVYSDTFDSRYKDAKKSSLELTDFMSAYPTVTARFAAITQAIAAEKAASEDALAKLKGASSTVGGNPVATPSGTTPLTMAASAQTGMSVPGAEGTAAGAISHTGFDSLSEDDQRIWIKYMKKIISSTIKLIVDDGSKGDLMAAIRGSPLAMASGSPLGLVLFHFDTKKACESTTRPDLRIPPLRETYSRLVKIVLEARATPPSDGNTPVEASLGYNEMTLILNGGKAGNATKLTSPWLPKKDKKDDDDEDVDDVVDDDADVGAGESTKAIVPTTLQVVKTEESLAKWRSRSRASTVGVKQMETAHLVSKGRISLPERQRQYFTGTNCGDTLTPVNIPAPDEVWRMSWKDKKQLFGKKNLIRVGDKTEAAEPAGVAAGRSDESMEPVLWHPMPLNFYLQMIDDFYVNRVFDLSALDGLFGWACLEKHVGYVGICFTKFHAEALQEHYISKLKVAMADAASTLYNPSYALAIGAIKKGEDDATGGKKPRGKKDPKAGGKPAGSAEGTGTVAAKKKARQKQISAVKKRKRACKVTGDDDEEGSEPFSGDGEESNAEDDDVWDPLEE